MTTKEQERKALEQIKKIVEGLGADSYIAMAFEGCFEDAEENIDNDWACSWKQRCADAQKNADHHQKAAEHYRTAVSEQAKEIESLKDKLEKSKEAFENCNAVSIENWNKFREVEDKLEARENEIIRLKAKLYDMMTA